MKRPNVILVMTDDQGYGDLGCTGNPIIQTPNLDRLAAECTRLQHFHVSPLCTPTRGALMTGRNPLRNGAWATTWGRSMLRRGEVTMAEVFADSGYETGMFGKWHLGDNYPYRPQDRGFQTVAAHRGGGVGQTPDFWGNTYFDDTYWRNGKPTAYQGYCTDIWFDEAMRFIESNRSRPFFCYLATNAPHAPYRVADQYKRPYLSSDQVPEPAFYGMITNIDENMGRLIQKLQELGIQDNTILIFMTDNGTSAGYREGKGFNAGMRGTKGSFYDGGHRVPFFVRWPAGGIRPDREIGELTTHLDLLPTFIDLCGLKTPAAVEFDGDSIAPLLTGRPGELGPRVYVAQNRQSTEPPEPWVCAVLSGRWRLVNGTELYDIQADPGQARNIAAQHSDVVAHLRSAYEGFWNEVSPTLEEYCPITIGSDEENPTRLDAFDLMGDVAWSQTQVRSALRCSGAWPVDVARAGTYEISLCRWPKEAGASITAALDDVDSVAIHPTRARLKVGHFDETKPVAPEAESVDFVVPLEAGRADLQSWFIDADRQAQGAYYAYVRRRS